MWHAVAVAVAWLIDQFASVFPSGSSGDAFSAVAALPTALFQIPASTFSLFGLLIDWQVFFACLYAVFAWRLLWLSYRVYRLVVGLIPLP